MSEPRALGPSWDALSRGRRETETDSESSSLPIITLYFLHYFPYPSPQSVPKSAPFPFPALFPPRPAHSPTAPCCAFPSSRPEPRSPLPACCPLPAPHCPSLPTPPRRPPCEAVPAARPASPPPSPLERPPLHARPSARGCHPRLAYHPQSTIGPIALNARTPNPPPPGVSLPPDRAPPLLISIDMGMPPPARADLFFLSLSRRPTPSPAHGQLAAGGNPSGRHGRARGLGSSFDTAATPLTPQSASMAPLRV